ncbi:MAG: hypothetical protein FVQ82_16950 [Planctomycetes bacterium]|nr:hypothetical protein [Planctomycetota bacterium]
MKLLLLYNVRRFVFLNAIIVFSLTFVTAEAAKKPKPKPVNLYVQQTTWAKTMHASAANAGTTKHARQDIDRLIANIYKNFPMETDWFLQDSKGKSAEYFSGNVQVKFEYGLISSVLDELHTNHGVMLRLDMPNSNPNSTNRLDTYTGLCKRRRQLRLAALTKKSPKIVFTKHFNLGGSHYAYTEGLSDAQDERHFRPGTALCLLEMIGGKAKVTTLIEDKNGVIRDPDVSWDGKRILFSWKKSDRKDDYHLYEMDVATKKVRQLTYGLGYADYEGIYLPDGDILFNSSRCVQTVDCWWTEVSNLYKCNKDGKNIHRITFDQVHTNYPQVMDDGRIIYTRWDYNDRGQIYPQPLFQMNADGTGQTEFYGNNSWFPTTIAHARGIPGSQKVVSILTGHHSDQRGKLAIIDTTKGRQEASGVQLIAPVQETKAVKIDVYGQRGVQFQYPYPLSEDEFIVTYCPLNAPSRKYPAPYAVGFVTADGRRELLAYDEKISCNQPVVLKSRTKPMARPSVVDYSKTTGTYYIQDVYIGPGLEGVDRGVVKEIRVVALEFRVVGIGSNLSGGPAGRALASTPIAISNGTWDVKSVLGDAKVYDDGSAFFEVPARTPVYFQAIDEKGHVAATMRSWSTLQPGENFSCVGCHESKDVTPARGTITKAMKAGPQKLTPFYGPTRGFSFPKEIQPILDKHCIKCHDGGAKDNGKKKPFSLLAKENVDNEAKRKWSDSYLALTKKGRPNEIVNWLNVQSTPTMLKPYSVGACKSKLMTMLENNHNKVKLSTEELEKIACWIDLLVPYCGDYAEANTWNDHEMQKYERFMKKRRDMEELDAESIKQITN